MGVLDAKRFSTQDHLDIEDIRDDMVVLKNGKVSVVIETTAINFDLLDTQEQDARIGSFASLLNSIRFPIQIVVRTQRTDIAKYMSLLEEYKMRSNSEAIADQVGKYQDFISNLTETTQILDKRFYTVIPSVQLPVLNTSWIRQLLGQKKRIINISQLLAKAKEELYSKRDHIMKQYGSLGVKAHQLKNDELIQLYYSVYEPDLTGVDTLNLNEADIERGLVKSK